MPASARHWPPPPDPHDDPPTPDGLPGRAALSQACHAFGLTDDGAVLLHHRSSAVYLLPHHQIVARLAPPTPLRQQRAHTAITVTRWAPLPGQQPVITGDAVATFWPTGQPPRRPPWPTWPRRYFTCTPSPPRPSRSPTTNRCTGSRKPSNSTEPDPCPPYPAPTGPGSPNKPTPSSASSPRLNSRSAPDSSTPTPTTKTSSATTPTGSSSTGTNCHGPRELDLITGLPSHFHEPETNRTAFLAAYGHDPTQTPGWQTLRDIAELHSLASYIRLAPTKPPAATELTKRVTSLRTGDQTSKWQAIS